MNVEEVFLKDSRARGMDRLIKYVPNGFCRRAARAIHQLLQRKQSPSALIVTGFYVNGAAETDGPPGAFFLYRSLKFLGFSVKLLTDEICAPLFRRGVCPSDDLIVAGLDIKDEEGFRQEIFSTCHPDLLLSVERCGRTRDGTYRSMRGKDISRFTAPLDALFLRPCQGCLTVGIGDGGNEIGMGTLQDIIREELLMEPSIVATRHLILSTVSNWGAYGLIRCLDLLSGANSLPEPKEVREWIAQSVEKGAVDGISGKRELKVDGYDLIQEAEIIEALSHCQWEPGEIR